MPPSALRRPVVRRSIIACAGDCARSRDGGLQPDQARLRPGERPRLPLARPLRRLRRRAVAQACATRSTTRSPGIGAPSCPTTCSCSRAPRPRSPADATPERMCAWAGELRSRIEPRAAACSRRRSPRSRRTLSPAQVASIEKRFAETNEEYRDDHLQRNPQRRQKARGQARGRARRDVLRPPRRRPSATCVAALGRPHRRTTPRSPTPSARSASRTCCRWCAACATANSGRDEAIAQVRALPERHRPLAARELSPLL